MPYLILHGNGQGQRASNGAIAACPHIQQQHCARVQMVHQKHIVMDRQLNASAEDLIGVLQDYSVPAEESMAELGVEGLFDMLHTGCFYMSFRSSLHTVTAAATTVGQYICIDCVLACLTACLCACLIC